MKRIVFYLFILAAFAESANAQLNVWRWQNPIPEGDYLYAVQMVSLSTIYACGADGYFVRTTNGGNTWDLQNNVLQFTGAWNSLSFANANFGMCCGDSGKAIRTTDGGSSWDSMKTGVTLKLNSIVLIDTNIALMVMLDGGILKTTDGGMTWFVVPSEGIPALYSIRKLRSDFLYITGYGGTVMTSGDTGNTWKNIKMPNGNTYYCACFTNDTTATVIGENGIILRTSNGGATWTRITFDSISVTATLNYVDGKDPNILTMVGDYGTVLYSADGGKSWSQFLLGTNEHIKCVSYFDTLNATAVGRDGTILMTTDGGKTWVFVPQLPEFSTLNSVAFFKGDTSVGIGVGYRGVIKQTTNGGKDWRLIQSGTVFTLRGVAFSDPSTAFAVGDYGTILKSTDAGLTWKPLVSNTVQDLFSVSFATPTDGLAVGDSNSVFKTYTAGEFWTREFPTPPSKAEYLAPVDYLSSVSYPDINHAFMTGWHVYYVSSDGGIHWTYKMIDVRDTMVRPCGSGFGVCAVDHYIALSFADSLHGGISVLQLNEETDAYVDSGNIVYSMDGLETWHWQQSRTVYGIFTNIFYSDNLRATVVGYNGVIAHSTDGGITWSNQDSHTSNNLFGVCFGTVEAGTAVGLRGNIIRITTDEKPTALVEQNPIAYPKIIIEGNYPNPFTQGTTINYSLPISGFTELKIFAIDGREISASPAEYQSAGDHSMNFDGTGLAPGTYIVRITAGALSAESKMILEK
jgi:photosystem II stability/assembly factor-like uncharacterized protein